MYRRCIPWIGFAILFFLSAPAFGHQTGKSALLVNVNHITDEVETLLTLPLRDVVSHLELDKNGDEKLDRDEIMATRSAMTTYFDKHLFVSHTGGQCRVS